MLEFLKISATLVLASYEPLSYKKTCNVIQETSDFDVELL